MRVRLLLAAACCGSALPGAHQAAAQASSAATPPAIDERYVYYEVAGATARELRAALNRERPKDASGERFDGLTRWHVRWRYRYRRSAGACRITSFTTSAEVVVTLPKWPGAPGSPLAARWERYTKALAQHERGHVEIAVGAARLIQERVSALEPAATCPLLERSIETRAQALLERARKENAAYDARTRHGATQGAVFP